MRKGVNVIGSVLPPRRIENPALERLVTIGLQNTAEAWVNKCRVVLAREGLASYASVRRTTPFATLARVPKGKVVDLFVLFVNEVVPELAPDIRFVAEDMRVCAVKVLSFNQVPLADWVQNMAMLPKDLGEDVEFEPDEKVQLASIGIHGIPDMSQTERLQELAKSMRSNLHFQA